MRWRRLCTLATAAALAATGIGVAGIGTAAAAPGGTLVSENPVDFTPQVQDGAVNSIVQVGDTIYLGGSFTQVKEAGANKPVVNRARLLAFDATTGTLDTTFDPVVDKGEVDVVLPSADGESLYIGGSFSAVDGQTHRKLAKIDAATGQPDAAFQADVNAKVRDLRLVDGRLYVGGNFTHVSGVAQAGIATLNPNTGARDAYFDLPVTGQQNGGTTAVIKMDVSPDGSRLVGVGNFTSVGGQSRPQIFMLDLTGAQARLANWQTVRYAAECSTSFDTYMRDVDFAPDARSSSSPPPAATAASSEDVRHPGPLGERRQRHRQAADLDELDGRRHHLRRRGHRRRRLHRRPLPLGEQPVRVRQGGRGRRGARGHRRPRPAHRPAVHLEPRPRPRHRRLRHPRHRPGRVDRQRHRHGGRRDPPEDRDVPRRRRHRAAGAGTRRTARRGLLRGRRRHRRAELPQAPLVRRRAAGAEQNGSTAGVDWRNARGGFMLSGRLYYGGSNGGFYSRTFDGTTLGAQTAIDTADRLVPMSTWHSQVASIQGMFYSDGKVYYTRGDAALHYRHFTPESGVVGAVEYTATNNLPAVDWRTVGGMFVSGGKLYYVNNTDGNLRAIAFTAGVPGGSPVVVDDGDWRGRSVFLHAAEPNGAPAAAFTRTCTGLDCAFDGSASTDGDGTVETLAWNFGDGETGSGVTPEHTYTEAGEYTVKVTVTDNRGGTDTAQQKVTVAEDQVPVAFRGTAGYNENTSGAAVTVPSGVQAGDAMLLFATMNTDSSDITPPAGWTEVGTQTNGNSRSTLWQKVAAAGDAGTAVTVGLEDIAKVSLRLVAYAGTASSPVAASAKATDSATCLPPAPWMPTT
ncbi:PKD domain-containing protein, partial [Actinomadura sp. CNU-125]|uniref:PKD domain-containing protein n=1 Tax=Actinomadura sp. CNU-125 TaxID=1904961 RepID=UPI000A917905